MQSNQTQTIPAALPDRVIRGRTAMNLLLIAGASLIVAIAAQVTVPVPFSTVPLTLQV